MLPPWSLLLSSSNAFVSIASNSKRKNSDQATDPVCLMGWLIYRGSEVTLFRSGTMLGAVFLVCVQLTHAKGCKRQRRLMKPCVLQLSEHHERWGGSSSQ